MRIWLLHMESYGDVAPYAEDTNILEIPFVKTELGYLDGAYEDERDQFIKSVERARERGSGEAGIEERFWVELVEVR
jgi:hypothetical protein